MTVKELREALKVYYLDQPEECKIIQKANKGDVTEVISLLYKIIQYWKNNDIDE